MVTQLIKEMNELYVNAYMLDKPNISHLYL
jgi:hypothetical protein